MTGGQYWSSRGNAVYPSLQESDFLRFKMVGRFVERQRVRSCNPDPCWSRMRATRVIAGRRQGRLDDADYTCALNPPAANG
jgi:hypothetical protein